MTAQQDTLAQLTEMGVSIWLDDISRDRLTSGNLAALVRDKHVRGVTSNPTIFAKALSSGTAYAEQVHDLGVRAVTVEEASRAITTYDIRWACDVLRPVYDATGGVDGRVSIEVDPRLAHDTDKTIAEARALWWTVDRPNLFIKIPATLEGLPAITQCLSEGISVNVTLIFSLRALRPGHRRFHGGPGGGDPAATSRASRPSPRSSSAGSTPRSTRGSTSSARRRRRRCAARRPSPTRGWPTSCSSSGRRRRAGRRWPTRGARPQRPLWASTSTKDPAYPDTMYVDGACRAGHGQHDARGDDPRDR